MRQLFNSNNTHQELYPWKTSMNYKIALSLSFSLYCVSLCDQKLAKATGSVYTETVKIPLPRYRNFHLYRPSLAHNVRKMAHTMARKRVSKKCHKTQWKSRRRDRTINNTHFWTNLCTHAYAFMFYSGPAFRQKI